MLVNITYQFRVEVRFGPDDASEALTLKATAGVHRFQTRSFVVLNPFQTIV